MPATPGWSRRSTPRRALTRRKSPCLPSRSSRTSPCSATASRFIRTRKPSVSSSARSKATCRRCWSRTAPVRRPRRPRASGQSTIAALVFAPSPLAGEGCSECATNSVGRGSPPLTRSKLLNRLSSPLPQGERAPQRAPRLRLALFRQSDDVAVGGWGDRGGGCRALGLDRAADRAEQLVLGQRLLDAIEARAEIRWHARL